MHAVDLAKKLGIVPEWRVDPDDEKKAYREAYRAKLQYMAEAYERHVRQVGRRPPDPGPKPMVLKPPAFPEGKRVELPETQAALAAQKVYADAVAEWDKVKYQTPSETYRAAEKGLEAATKAFDAARLAEELARDAVNRKAAEQWSREINDPWLDNVFFPAEADRVLWQTAKSLLDEWHLDQRANMLLRADWIRSWAPLAAYVGVGVAALGVGIYYVVQLLQ